MVPRLLSFFGKEWHNLNDAALLLSSCALFSQVLALVRDRLFAHYFGASSTLDVYYAAFRIPDFLYVSLASFVSVTVLIPILLEKMAGQAEANDEARKFISDVLTVFSLVIVVAGGALFFFIPAISKAIAPGFSPAELEKLVTLSRILLLSPLLIGVSNLLGSVTQAYRRFFVYALSPVFYNVGIIAGILFLYPLFGEKGLAMGVVLGALFHLLIQFPVLRAHRFVPYLSWRIDFSSVKQIVLVSLPRTLTLSMNQIALIVIVALASTIKEGSVSVFNFSYNLQSVPIIIIGVSYSVAAFPALIKFFSSGDKGGFAREIEAAARVIVFWSLPIAFLFIVLRAQLVRVLLGSGKFSWEDTRLTAAMLALFALSLVAQALMPLLVRGYYAAGHTKRPLYVNLFSHLLIVGLAFGLLYAVRHFLDFRYFVESLFRVSDLAGTEVLMLALAYSIGSLVNVFLLFRIFERDMAPGLFSRVKRTFFESFAASFLMGFAAYQFLDVFDDVFDLETFMGVFLQGFFSGILGIAVGLIVLKLLGSEELKQISAAMRHKFWKVKALAPEQAEL